MFSSEICKIFINNYFEEHLPTTASETISVRFSLGVHADEKIYQNFFLHLHGFLTSKVANPNPTNIPLVFHVETMWKRSSFQRELHVVCL